MCRLPRLGSLARCYHRHCPTLFLLRRRCSCCRTACICNRLETPTRFHEPYPWRRYCISRRCHQCWKIAVDWHTPTVGIEPSASPPSHSAVRHTNHCATAPLPKKMVWTQLILCAVYRDTVLTARCYHHHCPTNIYTLQKCKTKNITTQISVKNCQ